jgi:hypothetical protein
MNFDTYPGLKDAFDRSGIWNDEKYSLKSIDQAFIDVLPKNGTVHAVVGIASSYWFLLDDSILIAAKVFKMKTEIVPLKQITGIEAKRVLGQGWVLFMTRANNADEIPFFKKQETIRPFVLAVNERISLLNGPNGASSETPLDKIKKLKELLDMGVISQDEFDEKKSKLLKDI